MDLTTAVDAATEGATAPDAAESEQQQTGTPAVPSPGKDGKGGGKPAPKPEDERYEYELELEELDDDGKPQVGDDGKPIKKKVKEALTKREVNEILARRKRLDTAAFRKLEQLNKVWTERIAPFNERLARAKEDPVAALEYLAEQAGVDPVTITTQFAQRFMQQLEMTPEQRQAASTKAELDKLKQDRDKLIRDNEDREYNEKVQQFAAGERGRMMEAHQAAGLPKHPMVFKLMHSHAAAQARSGIQRPDYGLAAEEAKEFLRDATRDWLVSLPYEALVETLPKEVAEMLRKGDLARVAPAPGSPRPAGAAPVPAKKKPAQQQKFLSPTEWRRKIVGS